MSDDDYEVGYGRPPKKNQFQPGQSGNPGGRPKGAVGLQEKLRRALEKRIVFKKNGEECESSISEALINRTVEMALMERDVRAIKILFQYWPPPREEDKEDKLDWSKLSDEELFQMKSLVEKALKEEYKDDAQEN